ncbi:MAG: DoxX family membrane protein [Prolixibacteraceae bacterium]|nr:DoxX family membrane protein [Prolixibacteraceae bacterium]MBN2775309.1 DoxX family membrane protein [Prolixibacteraceae bacterium]
MYSGKQITWLVILRVAIGWHFLYEGLVKVLNPGWSSLGYLMDSKGFLSPVFHAMAANQGVLSTVDFLNQWGLVLIGLGLVLGALTRVATYSGMLLLAFYYLSHPPFIGIDYALPTEGNYFIIDKVFIEFCALGALALFPTGKYIGLDRFLFKK